MLVLSILCQLFIIIIGPKLEHFQALVYSKVVNSHILISFYLSWLPHCYRSSTCACLSVWKFAISTVEIRMPMKYAFYRTYELTTSQVPLWKIVRIFFKSCTTQDFIDIWQNCCKCSIVSVRNLATFNLMSFARNSDCRGLKSTRQTKSAVWSTFQKTRPHRDCIQPNEHHMKTIPLYVGKRLCSAKNLLFYALSFELVL